jgi:hypothetical protein
MYLIVIPDILKEIIESIYKGEGTYLVPVGG